MRRIIMLSAIFAVAFSMQAYSQINLKKAIGAGAKVVKAATLTDAEVETYVREYVAELDNLNPVCEPGDPYADRLENIVKNFNNRDGLNIKAYRVVDVNAFACADGSIRVFAGLMDIMSDEEILGVVGHEIGHIRNKDTKDAFRTALLSSAVLEGVGSTGAKAEKLTSSQWAAIGESLVNAKYSQKQEYEADAYGYDFLKSNGVNPWAMALSFEKLQKMQEEMGGNTDSKIQQLFSTHPDIAARAKIMSERAAADGFARPE